MLEEITTVDMDAEEFKTLPPEIQHELLMEMKDSYRRRYNRSKSQQMPEVLLLTFFNEGCFSSTLDSCLME